MKNKQAFTLVELIVVITILAILGTIGFIAYNGYLSGTRDTNRSSQLATIYDGLEVYRTKNDLPLPENSVEVRASGSVIGYQGYMGKNNLSTIEYSKGGLDPKDGIYFTYYITADKKYYQLMAYLEDESNTQLVNNPVIPTTYAVDYSKRYPTVYGKKLGILTESGTNAPIQEVSSIVSSGYLDIVTTTNTYKANFTDLDNITGTGLTLAESNPTASCKRILEVGGNKGNGLYTIAPLGTELKVYCDMTTDGGGWTVFQKRFNGSVDFYKTWNEYKLGFGNLSEEFWLGNDVINILTSTNKELYVYLKANDNVVRHAKYNSFKMANESNKYKLTLSGYSGDSGDSLSSYSLYNFSTYDQDNDVSGSNCAVLYHGAWWYASCHTSNLNGTYLPGAHVTYAIGTDRLAFRGYYEGMKETKMMLR